MARFVEIVTLSPAAHQDLRGDGERFAVVKRYLELRGITMTGAFQLDGTEHLMLVLEAATPPTRTLNRALAQAWPDSGDRPGLARMVNAAPWIQRSVTYAR
ncbi:MAG TPA: hypothetical protein VF995_04760 [Actinomycetota bacterium]